MHGFACVSPPHFLQTAPFPAQPERDCATALKPPCKAGGRGGESTARVQREMLFLHKQIADVKYMIVMLHTEFCIA
ncbi:hypothetical protein DFY89_12800 [Escherichia coli]|nr:hypothetical protein [Escherichia coli]